MITLKFDENEEQEELIKFLKEGAGDFELPKYFPIPKGERSMSQRARLLMIAGLESLKEKYPKNVVSMKMKNFENSKQEDVSAPEGWA